MMKRTVALIILSTVLVAAEPEVIYGHQMPPKPNPVLNDSTLLGIDINKNGVRDDVEWWIYETYENPIERGIFLQSARAYQKVIEDPNNAKEAVKYSNAALACDFYWSRHDEVYKTKYEYLIPWKQTEKMQFNTMERHMAYKRYNAQFNGEVLHTPSASKEACQFDENGNLLP